jgi:hypothetical protein
VCQTSSAILQTVFLKRQTETRTKSRLFQKDSHFCVYADLLQQKSRRQRQGRTETSSERQTVWYDIVAQFKDIADNDPDDAP